jgi:hypothetical protein
MLDLTPPTRAAGIQNGIKSGLTGKLRLDEVVYEQKDTATDQYISDCKVAFTYTEAGRIKQVVESSWVASASQWQPAYKEDFAFDTTGNQVQRIGYDYDIDAQMFIPSIRRDYAYDTLGLLHLTFGYNYDTSLKSWVNAMNTVFRYNAKSELVSKLSYSNYDSAAPWRLSAKDEHFYNSEGLATTSVTSFRLADATWECFWKLEYTYDSYGNRTSYTIVPWDNHTSQFTIEAKQEFIFDYNTGISELILPPDSWLSGDVGKGMFHKPVSSVGYGFQNGAWVPEMRATFHYTRVTGTGPELQPNGTVKVYPNPATGIIQVELKEASDSGTIEIFDISGRRIVFADFTGRTSLDISGKASGLLSYVIVTGNYRQTGKIVVNQ